MPPPRGFGSGPGSGPGSGSGSGSGCGRELNQPMAFDMQQFARRESMLAMAVNLPAPLPSSPASSAPSAPSAAGPADTTPLRHRRLPQPRPRPRPRPAPAPSSLHPPSSSSISSTLAFVSDTASASASAATSTSTSTAAFASTATATSASASIVSNTTATATTTTYNNIPPTTPVRGQTRLPSFATVTAAAVADPSSASSPPRPPLSPLDSSPSSVSTSSSSYTTSHPVLPPLPVNLPQESSPTYLPWTSIHHHFPGLDPLVSLSAPFTISSNNNSDSNINSGAENNNSNSNGNGTDADISGIPAHFSTPSFNHFPAALAGSQPLSFWPAYGNPIGLPAIWNDSAHALNHLDVTTALNQAVMIAANAPILPLSPALQSSRPPVPQPQSDEAYLLQDFDIHSDIDPGFGDRLRAENLRARARALASTFATFSATSASAAAAAAATTSSAQRLAAPRQRHRRAIHNLASPPALVDGFALPRTVTGAFNGIFDEPEDIPNFPFPFPLASTAHPPLSSSSATMPAASSARRRSRRQTITSETHDEPTSTSPSTGTVHANKRQRVVPSGTEANEQVIDDDDSSLFGDSKSLQGEDYTTIDLTEATDVPEELKKPKVDNRVKLSGFQCVICMDDVVGLTLTHCGHLFCAQCLHSSLNIDSTRGKCPMCRAKVDMKARDTYTTKTKGYWPLELKLMTRTRQGKRKAQAMT